MNTSASKQRKNKFKKVFYSLCETWNNQILNLISFLRKHSNEYTPYIVYIQFTNPYSPLYIVAHFYNLFYYIEEDKEW
ncbi:hypothetical protein EGW74_03600 [Enterococcus casseliflavus]|nr:hypothetical protein DW201_15505 [Enterococcus casseliflavus]ROY45547.1 hypothetical protein EGW74_03600 [Enterococcus casseliflavus]RXA71177.1 hypothetical protein EQ870_07655 [Enterococcus casseliflavus]